MNNLFITFEGGDGSGKSTQVNLLKDYLDNLNFETIKTREPGGTPSAEILRDLLTTGEVEKWTPMSEALLIDTTIGISLFRTLFNASKSLLEYLTESGKPNS